MRGAPLEPQAQSDKHAPRQRS